ncbi:hypothetical protein RUND412_004597 [Rhizina undulata]
MVHRVHGRLTGAKKTDFSELGGTKLEVGEDQQGFRKFLQLYKEEFKNTFRK